MAKGKRCRLHVLIPFLLARDSSRKNGFAPKGDQAAVASLANDQKTTGDNQRASTSAPVCKFDFSILLVQFYGNISLPLGHVFGNVLFCA